MRWTLERLNLMPALHTWAAIVRVPAPNRAPRECIS
jgi:hypothetical protein